MKSTNLSFVICLLGLSVFLSSCLKDKCEQSYQYKTYTPVYMPMEEIRAAIKTLPAINLAETGKIYYQSPYLFVNEIDKGIHVIDNSNPSSPQNISFINIPGNIDLAVKGNILYADTYIDLVALDISDPLHIVEVSRVENVFPNRIYNNGWAADPAKGIVVDWIEGDTTVTSDCYGPYFGWFEGDIMFASESSGGSSGNSSSAPGIGLAGSTARFAIYENNLYCLADASMKLFDISNNASPQPGVIVNMSWNIETIFPYSNYLFIGSTTGVVIYDNSNPSSPSYLSQFLHISSCDPVVVSGDYAYSTLRSGTACQGFTNQLDIIDISNISNPALTISYQMTNPYGLGIDNEILFICDGSAGLKMYDVSDPLNIIHQQTVGIQNPVDVIPADGLLIVVTESGIYQFDYNTEVLSN